MFTRFLRNSSLCFMEFFINDDIVDAYSKLQNQQCPFLRLGVPTLQNAQNDAYSQVAMATVLLPDLFKK